MLKKIILAALSLPVIFSVSFAQIKYGFKLGVTSAEVSKYSLTGAQQINAKTGFQFGAMAEINLIKHLTLRPALQVTQKGYKSEEGSMTGTYYLSYNNSRTYFEMPVDVVYKIPFSKTNSFFVGTGAVVSVGLFGKGNSIFRTILDSGQVYIREASGNKAFGNPGYKRIDLGADFLAGVQFNRLVIAASYTQGLINIINWSRAGYPGKVRNKCFAFTAGYFLRK